MFGLDDRLATLADGEALLVVLAVALLLGLRHATDPDHLAAVSTLIASDPEDGTQPGRAARARVGRRARHDARPVRPADRAVRLLPARVRAASGGGARGADDHVPRGSPAAALAERPLPRALASPRRRRAPAPASARTAGDPPRPRPRAGDQAGPIARAGVRDRARPWDGGLGGRGRAAAGDDPEPDRGGRGARGPRARDGGVDDDAVLGLRLRDHPRARAQADARLRARDGGRDARLRSLVRARRGGGLPYVL